ncbi:MAG TPA: SDR family NAD(P)-dependent oxidoreductase, partial [Candidatus Krumholzibacteriaceae bacterium]|nr:SDR family NAD(P)-dependent oxidoreductase [Candidatus Krumholzibacteriaceae bacterium]
MDLKGKTAIVTGAGQGIGREIALALAGSGVDIAVVDVNPEGASETVSLIEEKGAGGLALECDIADSASVAECVSSVLGWHDQVHFLINNAGVTRDNLLLRMKDE